jgi:hypothetical protein
MDVSALRPDRPVVVGAFVVVFVAASATFALTAAGHYDTYTADRLGGTITGYDVVEEDGERRVVAEMTVENGLNRPVTVGAGQLRVVAADEKLTLNAGGFVGERVPAGGERTFRVSLRLQEEEVSTAAAAARNGTLKVSGIYRATIEAEEIEFSVSTGGETDG